MSHCNHSEWAPVPLNTSSFKHKKQMCESTNGFLHQTLQLAKRKDVTEEKYSSVLVKHCDYRCVERLELKPAYFFCFKFQPLYTGFGEALLSERLPLSIVKIDLPALITFHSPFFLSCASSC